MTLWQRFLVQVKAMWKKHFGQPVEYGFWNPAKAKLKDGVAINSGDGAGKDFYVDGIRQYTRTYKGEQVVSTAYDVSHKPLSGDKVRLRLWYMPLAEEDGRGRNYVVLLKQTDAMEYDPDLHTALVPEREDKPDNGEFEVFDGKPPQVTEKWWRVDDQRGPIKATVAVVKAPRDGHAVTVADLGSESVELWDFNREIDSDGGVKFKQYQFYEMVTSRGRYTYGYRGEEVDELDITWNFI